MKHLSLVFRLAVVGLAAVCSPRMSAQIPSQNRVHTLFHLAFQRDWDVPLTDPVKLIEIGPVVDPKKNNLLMLVGGKDSNDYKRRLVVTHWAGFQFANDYSTEFLGTALDALLIGQFVTAKPAVVPTPQPGKKVSKSLPANQVVTTEGIYAWEGKALSRLYAAPPGVRLALMFDKVEDELVTGFGGNAIHYGISDKGPQALETFDPPTDNGYVRYGVGMQSFPGDDAMAVGAGVRYAQSLWSGRTRWFLGVARGKPAPTNDMPNLTSGDRLVVYTLKFSSRAKSFWEAKQDDFEEAWRSDPMPGQILDVRIGDPKNEGKDGILILTAENSGKDRHLYFFTVVPGSG